MNFHDHITNASREVNLSADERARMRSVVESYMAMRPLRRPQAAPRYFFGAVFLQRAAAFAVALALVGSSAGISYAAESALPGDPLYAVKININEPLRGALAVTPQAKAAWAIDIAGARATEAATLAAENKLTASTSMQLQESFVSHARQATASIAAQSQHDPAGGAEIATRFEARLSEYERVLSAIRSDGRESMGIASAIRAEREHVMALGDDASSDDTAHLHVAAQEGITAATELIPATRGALSTTTAAQVALTLDQANDSIASGQDLLSKDEQQARGEFRRAIRGSERLSTYLETTAAIHQRTGLVITGGSLQASSSAHAAAQAKVAAPMIRASVMMAPATVPAAEEQPAATDSSQQSDAEVEDSHILSIPVPDLDR